MKAIQIIGHPIVLTVVFLLLLIEGDHFGGFYLLYLLLALPHSALYALLAVGGIALLLINYYFLAFKRVLSVAAVLLMIASLVVFFGKGNKNETFELGIPLLTFILFGMCLVCYFIRLFGVGLGNDKRENKGLSTI